VETQAPDAPTDQDVLCPLCGYNLRGLPKARCPECGADFGEWANLAIRRYLNFRQTMAMSVQAIFILVATELLMLVARLV
jgi:hypothetical protein